MANFARSLFKADNLRMAMWFVLSSLIPYSGSSPPAFGKARGRRPVSRAAILISSAWVNARRRLTTTTNRLGVSAIRNDGAARRD